MNESFFVATFFLSNTNLIVGYFIISRFYVWVIGSNPTDSLVSYMKMVSCFEVSVDTVGIILVSKVAHFMHYHALLCNNRC